MIKGSQIPVCDVASRELSRIVHRIKEIRERLRAAGLAKEADDLHDASEHVRVQAHALGELGLEAFRAARRDEELPK